MMCGDTRPHHDIQEARLLAPDLSISAQNTPPRGTQWSQQGEPGREETWGRPSPDCPGSVVNKNNWPTLHRAESHALLGQAGTSILFPKQLINNTLCLNNKLSLMTDCLCLVSVLTILTFWEASVEDLSSVGTDRP